MPVQITHISLCVLVCVYRCVLWQTVLVAIAVRGGGNSQLSTGNWQHSNPISHACNHHDHYERKCRKSRRFLTATERPPSDRATDRVPHSLPPYSLLPRHTPPERVHVRWFFVSGRVGILFESHSHCSFSWRRHLSALGIKRRTKLCGMQKVATLPPTPQPKQPRSGAEREQGSLRWGVAFYVASNYSK